MKNMMIYISIIIVISIISVNGRLAGNNSSNSSTRIIVEY
jgi:hypothetical protein